MSVIYAKIVVYVGRGRSVGLYVAAWYELIIPFVHRLLLMNLLVVHVMYFVILSLYTTNWSESESTGFSQSRTYVICTEMIVVTDDAIKGSNFKHITPP